MMITKIINNQIALYDGEGGGNDAGRDDYLVKDNSFDNDDDGDDNDYDVENFDANTNLDDDDDNDKVDYNVDDDYDVFYYFRGDIEQR